MNEAEIFLTNGGEALIVFEPVREKLVTGVYAAGTGEHSIVFWGGRNDLPDYREALIEANNIVPQVLRAKRDIILGGGLVAYTDQYEAGKKIAVEQAMPAEFEDFIEGQELEHGGLEDMCDDLLMHGQYYAEVGTEADGAVKYLRPHRARCVRAEMQDVKGKIPAYWLYGRWGAINDVQRLQEMKELQRVPAYEHGKPQRKFMYQGSDRLLGGPYYYTPHYWGSEVWIKVANAIPRFHLSNLENGFNIRYVIKVPEDYFLRSLTEAQRKDTNTVSAHLTAAKTAFKDTLNKFLAGADNSGRAVIFTKHFYKHLNREWPELTIEPLEVDLKDEAMLKLFDSTNTATTSAHGIPPSLAGLATGGIFSSGSEIRNLYNFWQISAATMPRKQLLEVYRIVWRMMNMPPDVKLGFRNLELTTTDKNPTGTQAVIDDTAKI